MQWTTEQVANIINFFAAVGTVGGLLFAFYLERKNRRDINQLAKITEELAAQNKLLRLEMKGNVAPNLKLGRINYDGIGRNAHITFVNNGHTAYILHTEGRGTNMTITRSDTIRKLETQHQIFFDGRVDPQSHFGDCTWEITIDYQDIYGNIYHLHQTGKGVNSKEPTITED